MPNTATNSCGYDAYVRATHSNMSLEEFQSIVQSDEMFEITQILNVAQIEGVNLVIQNQGNLLISKNDMESDLFFLMYLDA